MKTLWFSARCGREVLRDKFLMSIGIVFPVAILLVLSMIAAGIPEDAGMTLFYPDRLTPGVASFGLAFFALFSAFLVAKDRESAFMMRLLTSPLSAGGFLVGYILPLVPLALAQSVMCYLVAMILGLSPSVHILSAIFINIPTALFFIGTGVVCGLLMNSKQVGGICGALVTNLAGWFSGTWFEPALVGGVFETIANVLPFVHMVNVGRAALAGDYGAMFPAMWWVIGYTVLMFGTAAILFMRKMKKGV